MPRLCHKGLVTATDSAVVGAKKATIANKGTISKSSNSKIDTICCPPGLFNSLRSPKTCITIAVEVSTKPAAHTNATCHGKPNAMPTTVSAAAANTTCMLPKPKIWRRNAHKCDGFISRPMINKNITTPNSATWMMALGSLNSFSPNGPIASPAAK